MNWGVKLWEELDVLVSCHNTRGGLVLRTTIKDRGFTESILFNTGLTIKDLYDRLRYP